MVDPMNRRKALKLKRRKAKAKNQEESKYRPAIESFLESAEKGEVQELFKNDSAKKPKTLAEIARLYEKKPAS